jgi:GT2 family glycosyltransferase
VDLLRLTIDTLCATAARRERLEILVVDNGSTDRETLDFLEDGRRNRHFRVLTVDEPFNWSRLNNLAASASNEQRLLFVNNDIEMVTPSWDDVLRVQLTRPEIGALGARLAYPDRTLQHCGIVFGIDGRTEHEGVGHPASASGPGDRWLLRRTIGAVTGAFLACRRDVFDAVGGFDEHHLPVWFNDVDFCLKVRNAGLRVLYEPSIFAVHHESKSLAFSSAEAERKALFTASAAVMADRWSEAMRVDPGFNPHYARWGRPFDYLREPSLQDIELHARRSATGQW